MFRISRVLSLTLFFAVGAKGADGPVKIIFVPGRSPIHLRSGGTIGPVSAPSRCLTPIVDSALRPSEVQRLGTHRVGQTVEFRVPPHTGTISIIEQAAGSNPQTIFLRPPFGFSIPNGAVPTLVTDPRGRVIYDDMSPFPADLSAAHALTSPIATTGVMTFPNTTQALIDSGDDGYPDGTWSFQVNDYSLECTTPGLSGFCSGTDTGQYDLTVLTKRVARPSGKLDVSIYLASETLNVAQALASSALKRYVQTLATFYGQAGIDIDTLTVYDLPAWAKSRFAAGVDATDLGSCSEFRQMLTLSQPGDDVSFFFVDVIRESGTQSGEIVGIDGSIPGPASMSGTVGSGAAVNMSDLQAGSCGEAIDLLHCGADEIAYISAHEAGHFMGLFHTTEPFGFGFDPLSDTPRCMCGTGVLTADVCSQTNTPDCGGGDNLMFWLLQPPFSKGTLSSQQGRVMRANPAVR